MVAFDRLKDLWVAPSERRNVRAMENAALERIERLLERLAVHAVGVDTRLERIEQRLDGLERGQEALRIELRERFESLDEQFRTLSAGVRMFEVRVSAHFEQVDGRLGTLEKHAASTVQRLDALEQGSHETSRRLDLLSDDIKQRFRTWQAG